MIRSLPFAVVVFLLVSFHLHGQVSKIEPGLSDALDKEGQAEFLVILAQQADLRAAENLPTKIEKGRFVFETLSNLAESTQKPVRNILKAAGAPMQSFWVINGLWSRGDRALVEGLAAMPEVARLEANPIWHLGKPVEMPQDNLQDRALVPDPGAWGLTKIDADDVWNLGHKGAGVVVGGQDTGYEWEHPALKNKYRGWNGSSADHNYNWHDAIHSLIGGGSNSCGLNLQEPCDDGGHGTHTMGTMVGSIGDDPVYGVAPEAEWMGCRNMEEGDGQPSTYIECFEWFIAPTNLNNQNPNSAMAPHVINNSWGCPTSEGCNSTNFATMETVITNVRSAGIVVVASAGNGGPNCSTVNDPPAMFSASFSVGATNSSDGIAGFSSRGPVTVWTNIKKPDIAAPGVNIKSCIGTDNNPATYGYASYNGTSMAGPHVAGVVALVISANPSLAGQVTDIETILKNQALPLYVSSSFCGTDNASSRPNNVFGWGRVRALQSVLPVEWVSFDARAEGRDAILTWETAQEVDCAYFQVQRSADGLSWANLNKITCQGGFSGGRYHYRDVAPGAGRVYYRLVQADYSGVSSLSPTASALFLEQKLSLRIVPLPSAQALYVDISGDSEGETWKLELVAPDGRILVRAELEHSTQVALPELPAGWYTAVVRDKQDRMVLAQKMIF